MSTPPKPMVRLSWFDRGLSALTAKAAWDIRASTASSARTLQMMAWLQADGLGLNSQLVELATQIDLDLAELATAVEVQTMELLRSLNEQSRLLAAQNEILGDMREALRRPARTRAAERLLDAAELIRRGRYERALSACSAAIEDDPNNPDAFWGGALALIGLERFAEARAMLEEAAAAADGSEAAKALRAASRVALEAGDAAGAVQLSRRAESIGNWEGTERAMFLIEQLVCEVAVGDEEAARRVVEQILEADWRAARLALESQFVAESATTLALIEQRLREVLPPIAAIEREAMTAIEEAEQTASEVVVEAGRGYRLDKPCSFVAAVREHLADTRGIGALSTKLESTVKTRDEATRAKAAMADVLASVRAIEMADQMIAQELARAELAPRRGAEFGRRARYCVGLAWLAPTAEACLQELGRARDNIRQGRDGLGQILAEGERERERAAHRAAEHAHRIAHEAAEREQQRRRDALMRASSPTEKRGRFSRERAAGPSWQADPLDERPFRWWDGLSWTEHVADDPSGGPPR